MQGKTIGNVTGLGVRSSGDVSGLTLVVALRRLGDADAQLAAVGVDAHHGAVGRGAGQRRDLRGVPGDAVQRLGDVGRALQDQVLRTGQGQLSRGNGTFPGAGAGAGPSHPRQPDLVVVGGPIQGLDQVSGSFQQHFLRGQRERGVLMAKNSSVK